MLVSFVSSSSSQHLWRRKGGSGHGSSGGSTGGKSGSSSSGSTGGKSGSSSSGSTGGESGSSSSGSTGGKSGSSSSGSSKGSSSSSRSPISVKTPAGSNSRAVPYSGGSPKVTTIGTGQPFAGRSIGGGTRSSVFGNRQYGSGYPGFAGSSVFGRGFPYYFWPVVWGGGIGARSNRYHTTEYGGPDNSSRPGGALFDAPFQSPNGNDTYYITADNATVNALITAITANCSLRTTSIIATPYNDSDPNQPKAEQVVQYYRASSIALALDGYNDSAVFSSDANATDTPLPSNINATFLDCLNQTIGAAAPLIDNSAVLSYVPIPGLLGLIIIAFHWLGWAS